MTPDPVLWSPLADPRADGADGAVGTDGAERRLLAFAAAALAIEGITLEPRSLRQVARAAGRLRPETGPAAQAANIQAATTLPATPACPDADDAAFAALLHACR